MRQIAAMVVFAALLYAGCSGSGGEAQQATTSAPPSPAETAPAPAPTTGAEPSPGTTSRMTMEAVVRAWSRALNAGDNEAVAALFALPAIIAQGDRIGQFETYEDIATFHSGLPCSGTVVGLTFGRDEVIAVFELGDRGDMSCDSEPGTRAAARFVFRGGKIVAWQQIPVPEDAPPATETTPEV